MNSRMSVALSLNEDISFLLELKPSELSLVIEESVLDALNDKQEIRVGLPGTVDGQAHERAGLKRVKILNPMVYKLLRSFKTEMRGSFVSKSISDYSQSSGGAILMENLKARLNPDTIIHFKDPVTGGNTPIREETGKPDDKDHFLKRLEGDFS